jgi:Flp pilus assembly protein protease CpaA
MSGLTLGFAIWIAFFVIGAIGAGDVKLFAAAGAWLGPGATWRAALVAAALGGILAVAMLLRERRAREGFAKVMVSVSTRSVAALAPDPAMPRSRQLPYGVALACGALIVAWIPGVLAWTRRTPCCGQREDPTDVGRGAIIVEFALIVPLLFLIVFGIIDFSGRTRNSTTSIRHARRGRDTPAAQRLPTEAMV